MREAVRHSLALLDARQRRQWLLLLPLALAVAAFEAAGAALIFALIRLVGSPSEASEIPLAALLQRVLPSADHSQLVASFGLAVAFFYILKNGLRLFETYAQERCAGETIVMVSRRLLRGYLAAPYSFHLQRNSATLIRDAQNSSEMVARAVLSSAILIVSHCLVVLAIMAVVVFSAPWVAICTAGVLGGLMVAMLRLTRRRVTTWGELAHQLRATALKTLQQSLGGVKEVKVLGREAFFEAAFARARSALARIEVWRRTFEIGPHIVVETIFICGVAALIVGAQVQGVVDLVPVLGLFAYAGLRILPSLREIVNRTNRIRYGSAALDEIYSDWVALAEHASLPRESRPGPRLAFRDRISFDEVSYRYTGASQPALKRLSFSIERGESVGIVGPTGSGKSTLVDLLLGLLHPFEGYISVDGRDIHEQLGGWQRQIGYVPQTIYLTDDSVRRNVALGLEDDEIEDAQLHAALRLAQLESFVSSLPRGLDSVVGERGVRLSGGQRQRVAVARALYGDPEVLVFDEATAALDHQTERELTRGIESLQRKKTLVIIAHRLSTVRRCDRLIFLENGRVVDIGPYDELLARNSRFRQMAIGGEERPGSVEEH